MPVKREKHTMSFSSETMKLIEKHYLEDGCRFRSDFIEKAVRFYCGYLTAEDYREYLPNIIVSTMKGTLDSLESRMANLLFREAVEISMLLHVEAATHEVDEETLSALRRLCINDVKKLQGTIRLEDAVRFQKG